MIDCMDCIHVAWVSDGLYGCMMNDNYWFADRGKHAIKSCDDYERAKGRTNKILTAAWSCAEVTCASCPVDCRYFKLRSNGCAGYLITELAHELAKAMSTEEGSWYMDTIFVQCSCCGNHVDIPASLSAADNLIQQGWNSYGGVLYCPECCATWDERNRGRPLAGRENTIRVLDNIWHRQNGMVDKWEFKK